MNDNTTPMAAAEYDQKINNTIPYYSEFYVQALRDGGIFICFENVVP